MSTNPNTSVKPEVSEREIDQELIDRTNGMLQRAGERAIEDRAIAQQERQQYRESAAQHGGWIPGGASDAQRQELREDWQRRQEWNKLIEGGQVAASAPERSIEGAKPPAKSAKAAILKSIELWTGPKPRKSSGSGINRARCSPFTSR